MMLHPAQHQPTRRSFLTRSGAAGLYGAAVALGLPGLGLAAAPSAEPGFDTLDMDWRDSARQRDVPVRLYLPRATSAGARVPLVVFSHGIGGSRRGYSYLGTHWASHGCASLHLQHVGSDRALWSGGLFSMVGRLQAAAQDTEAIARALDLRFALDRLMDSEHASCIDGNRLVAAGHSYGANTTLLAAGAQVPRGGATVNLQDARVKAAIVISAPPFYGETNPGRILRPITVPSLHITATEDIIRIPGYYSGFEDRVAVYEATGSERKWLAVFEGGSHSMFTDRAGTGGALLNPRVKQATRQLSLAFLRSVFDQEDAGLQAWPRDHADILARVQGWG